MDANSNREDDFAARAAYSNAEKRSGEKLTMAGQGKQSGGKHSGEKKSGEKQSGAKKK